MKDNTVFWQQANGKLVSVDEMDTNHIKNAFKYLIKKHEKLVKIKSGCLGVVLTLNS